MEGVGFRGSEWEAPLFHFRGKHMDICGMTVVAMKQWRGAYGWVGIAASCIADKTYRAACKELL